MNIKWMVTGAAGRVLLLESVYGLPHGRATEDVDLGVMVANWAQYQALVERLCHDMDFHPDPKQRQRLRFHQDGILDLIPFGGIESSDRTIRWPPDNDFAMSVMGFREAYAEAVEVRAGGIVVPVVNPAGLMLLKLVAWSQRRHTQPKKDAADIAYLLRHYSAIETEKTLFDHYFATVAAVDFDMDLPAARVLVQKLASMAAQDTQTYFLDLFDKELKEKTDSALVCDIAEHMTAGEERVCHLLENLAAGFVEKAKP
ncbi:MAG: nucleotidyl transferase AbiEii/AbiGii toxin family protein [Gammaproteobacteria bacterium]|nr:nucleotidyl transferase AbiEii/AbiGii toxin family protein [Gammaproteobacteria bacterium]